MKSTQTQNIFTDIITFLLVCYNWYIAISRSPRIFLKKCIIIIELTKNIWLYTKDNWKRNVLPILLITSLHLYICKAEVSSAFTFQAVNIFHGEVTWDLHFFCWRILFHTRSKITKIQMWDTSTIIKVKVKPTDINTQIKTEKMILRVTYICLILIIEAVSCMFNILNKIILLEMQHKVMGILKWIPSQQQQHSSGHVSWSFSTGQRDL